MWKKGHNSDKNWQFILNDVQTIYTLIPLNIA